MDSVDFWLGVVVLAIVPLFFAAYGGHLAAEPLSDPRARRKVRLIFWSAFAVGIILTIANQYRTVKAEQEREYKAARTDEERQKKADDAQRAALQAQADLAASERSNGLQIRSLQRRVEDSLSRPHDVNEKEIASQLRSELAAALAQSKSTGASSSPPPVQIIAPPVPAKPCRGDHLEDCNDAQLLDWGKPLLEKITQLSESYSHDLDALDAIRGGGVFSFFTGNDKDSKWLRAYSDAQSKASDNFRDCCAQSALQYHKELVLRVGGGTENVDFYDWVNRLLSPINSKAWKKARQETMIYDVRFSISHLQIQLDTKIKLARIR